MRSLLVVIVLVAAGCRYQPSVIPLTGDDVSLRQLAGHWEGEYAGNESGRSGPITFDITSKGDSAYGDVRLITPGGVDPFVPVDMVSIHLTHASAVDLLSIQFVRAVGDTVRGVLEPYRAPDCNCVARTLFTGRVHGDRIAGTFITTFDTRDPQHGTWQIKRVKQ